MQAKTLSSVCDSGPVTGCSRRGGSCASRGLGLSPPTDIATSLGEGAMRDCGGIASHGLRRDGGVGVIVGSRKLLEERYGLSWNSQAARPLLEFMPSSMSSEMSSGLLWPCSEIVSRDVECKEDVATCASWIVLLQGMLYGVLSKIYRLRINTSWYRSSCVVKSSSEICSEN